MKKLFFNPKTLLACFTVLAIIGINALTLSTTPSQLVLWSWQRKDDLSFINKETLIAPLVGTIVINKNGLRVYPRSNPLSLNASAKIIPVVRLEINPNVSINIEMLEKIIFHILTLTHSFKAEIIQIDFDATTSQRPFYKKLLTRLNLALPTTKISITALASWCLGDPWIEQLPIAFAVPMAYNLGEEAKNIRKILLNTKQWKACKCHGYIGLNRDNLFMKVPKGWTVFVFNDEAWTLETYKILLKKIS